MKVIDAHAHIFMAVNGEKQGVKTSSGANGRVRIGNEEFPFLLPIFERTSFPVEMLVELMDFSVINKAVLMQNPVLGIVNDEIKTALEKYPERFVGTIQIDPMDADACKTISKYASAKQNTLKLEISEEWGWSGKYPGFSLVGKEMSVIWDKVNDLGLRVIIDTGVIFNNGYQSDNIGKIASQYPNTKILIEHLGYLSFELQNNPVALKTRNELLKLGREHHNIYFGFSATSSLLREDYPCPASLGLLKEAVKIMGPEKILWGSDIPSTLNGYTYRQMVDIVAKHAGFLSEEEKRAVLYQNTESFFF